MSDLEQTQGASCSGKERVRRLEEAEEGRPLKSLGQYEERVEETEKDRPPEHRFASGDYEGPRSK